LLLRSHFRLIPKQSKTNRGNSKRAIFPQESINGSNFRTAIATAIHNYHAPEPNSPPQRRKHA
jgi:hypothetical protein